MHGSNAEGLFIVATLMVVAVIVIVIVSMKRDQRLQAAWRDALRARGLRPSPGDGWDWSGTIDDVAVRVRTFFRGSGKNRRRFTSIECRGGRPAPIEIGRESFFSRLVGEDITIGDAAFDHFAKVRGRRADVLATLDHALRTAVTDGVQAGWGYRDGAWELTVPGYLEGTLAKTIDDGVHFARSTHAVLVGPALLERSRTDPSPGVRRAALEELLGDRSPEGYLAAREALDDPDPIVRLLAASALVDVDVLVALVDPDLDPAVTGKAIDTLVRHAPDDPRTRAALGESRLIALLDASHEGLRHTAARALGALGTISAVPALTPLRDKLLGGAMKDVARDAILAIQARAGAIETGRLTVVEGGEQDAHGALSLSVEESAQ